MRCDLALLTLRLLWNFRQLILLLPSPAMTISSRERFSYDAATLGLAAGVVVLAAILYFLTAARDIVVGDAPEFITVAATLGVPHAPGYPLFTMLGHLFSMLPLGPIPFRVNLLCATCDALAVGVVYLTAFRLTGQRLAAASAALLLAINSTFWTWSLAAEVFPLNNLLASLLIFLLVSWHEQPERTGVLTAAFFVGGLGLTNQQTIVLLVPAFCFVLWVHRAFLRTHPRALVTGAVSFFIGLLPYAYVPWASSRHPFYNWGEVSSFRKLLGLIARRSYGTGHLVSTTEYLGGSAAPRIQALLVSLGPLLGLMTVLGMVYAFRRRRWYFWFCLLAFAGVGPFFVYITNLNLATAPSALFVLEKFFLLSHVVVAPLAALGVLLIAELISSYRATRPGAPVGLVAGILFVAIFASVFRNYREIDQSHNHIARTFAEDVLTTVAPETILFTSGDAVVLPLTYLHDVEKKRPDVTLIVLPLLPADWYLRQLRERYHDLSVPFDHYDGQLNGLKTLLEANKGRTAAVVGSLPNNEKSLEGSYWFYQHGLVNIIKPAGQDVAMRDMAADNEQLMESYHPPVPQTVRIKTFEKELLSFYAAPALRIGYIYERTGRKTEAVTWYDRAIALDPYLPQARDRLAR